jgi:hypothetical protein
MLLKTKQQSLACLIWRPMISADLALASAMLPAANSNRSNFCSDMFRSKLLRNIWGASSEFKMQSTIASVSSPELDMQHKDE